MKVRVLTKDEIESLLLNKQNKNLSQQISGQSTVEGALTEHSTQISGIKDGTDIDSFGDVEDALDTKADLVNGLIPASQLPSYVDDVIEVSDYAHLPAEGESGKIYVTLDTNYTYRWGTTAYIKINDVDLTNYYTKSQVDAMVVLPTASTSTLGGVKVDGTSIKINNGVISTESHIEIAEFNSSEARYYSKYTYAELLALADAKVLTYCNHILFGWSFTGYNQTAEAKYDGIYNGNECVYTVSIASDGKITASSYTQLATNAALTTHTGNSDIHVTSSKKIEWDAKLSDAPSDSKEYVRKDGAWVESSGASAAGDISYDNTSSGLTADDVQEAIDEIVSEKVDLTDVKHTPSASDKIVTEQDLPTIETVDNKLMINDVVYTNLSGHNLGEIIYIEESGSPVQYILVEKRENAVILLRMTHSDLTHSYAGGGYIQTYINSELDNWMEQGTTGYKSLYSSYLKSKLVNTTILCRNTNGENESAERSVFVPSAAELNMSRYSVNPTDGNNWLPAIKTARGMTQATSDQTARATGSWYYTRTGYTGSTEFYVRSNGDIGDANTFTNNFNVRPAISLSNTTPVYNGGYLENPPIVYSADIDTIVDNGYRKIKDIDGRVSSNIAYDNTASGLSATNVKAAVDELNTEKQDSAISITGITAVTVEGALDELNDGIGDLDTAIQTKADLDSSSTVPFVLGYDSNGFYVEVVSNE